MVGEPPESPRSGGSHHGEEGDERESAGERLRTEERERQGERVGPLRLTRRVKDDGRRLILYAREPQERS
jgi:hypothetical protein